MPSWPSDVRRKRILFVDDEPMVLDGLQRMLRARRKQWDSVFVESGEAAMAELEASRFDVIVTDMRMPGMDGATLLEYVRERFPNVIRIVLSGYFEKGAALRSLPLAHQFLAKPCDPSKLGDAIERCCSFDRYIADEATQRIVGAIGDLPSLPQNYSLLMDALKDPEVSVGQVGKIVEKDVGITAKVLQLVNSAFFGPSAEIASVQVAVSYLGLDILKAMLVSAEIFGMFRPAARTPGFSMEGFQEHCRLSAKIAGRLPLPKAIAPTAVAAAMLHDVGILVISTRLPQQFGLALSLSLSQGRPLFRVEEELTSTTHAEIGAYLLGVWGLPSLIVDAVGRHHRPGAVAQAGRGLDVHAAVRVADVLARDCQTIARDGFPVAHDGLDVEYLQALGVADDIPAWRAMAEEIAQTPERS